MPSAAESLILLYVLGIVFASLPVAMLLRGRRVPALPASMPPLPAMTSLLPPGAPPLPVDYYAPPHGELFLPPAPDSRSWSRQDAWFAFVLAVVVAVLMGPVSAYLVAKAGFGEDTKISFTAGLFITQIVFQAGVIGLVLAWLVAYRKFNLVQRFGLRARGFWMTTGLTLLCLVLAYIGVILVSLVSQSLMENLTGLDLKQQGLVESAPEITDNTTRVLMLITLCLGAPLMEELIFRGVLYSVMARYLNPWYACVASSLFFGLIHGNLLSLIPLTVLGMFLAEAYRRTGTLAVPVLMHAIFNLISYLAIFYGPPELRQ